MSYPVEPVNGVMVAQVNTTDQARRVEGTIMKGGLLQGLERSVYPEERREAAEEVLRELVNARLLTGYREQNHDERPVHRVEIVHESLLTSWPRLVRWQTQDADSARLRDEAHCNASSCLRFRPIFA